jgi:hypothetical protein
MTDGPPHVEPKVPASVISAPSVAIVNPSSKPETPPQSSTSRRSLDLVAKVAEILAAIAVVCGIGLAIAGYRAEQNARLERFTFDFTQNLFKRDELHEPRARLLARVRDLETQLASAGRAPNTATYFQRLARGSSDDAATFRADLLALLDHYNGAAGCVNAGLCDISLMRTLYMDEATTMYSIFGLAMREVARAGQADALVEGILAFVSVSAVQPEN